MAEGDWGKRDWRGEVGWIAEIFARNAVLIILIAGGLQLRLYTTKGQGIKFKYNDGSPQAHAAMLARRKKAGRSDS